MPIKKREEEERGRRKKREEGGRGRRKRREEGGRGSRGKKRKEKKEETSCRENLQAKSKKLKTKKCTANTETHCK